ncbi:MAG TPA: hypothetical protein DCZ94_03410 [Lentisphaeria bacterium]|nr:MAG: hypothetical protein A2X48_04070 [Lentisphaerae bacterium GWF2_49_21]HBC85982.1 hypothetical protein [Lentisphaeria bacterium]
MKRTYLLSLVLLLSFIPPSYPAEPAGGVRRGYEKFYYQLFKNIRIPKMEFKDAPADKVLSEIYKAVLALDVEKKGLNMVMFLDPEQKDKPPLVNMKFDESSLFSVIKMFCNAADLRLCIEKDIIYFYPTGTSTQPFYMETRIYPMEKDAFYELGESDSPLENKAFDELSIIEQYFGMRGIPFPPGAKIVFDLRIARLIVTHTPDNLTKIEEIIHELNVVDPQVGIGIKYLKITETDFRNAVGEDVALNPKKINSTLYAKLMECPKTQVVADSYVLTQNGQEATVRMINEKYLPTSWGESNLVEDNRNVPEAEIKKDDKEKQKTLVSYSTVPDLAEPTELGVRLTVTPTVDADRYTISLDMTPILQSHVGWTDYQNGGTNAKMPEFAVSTAETKLVVYDGSNVLLESSSKDEPVDGGDKTVSVRHFIFVTVKLVNPDGLLLRNKDEASKTVIGKAGAMYEEVFDFGKADSSVAQKLATKVDFEITNATTDKFFETLAAKMNDVGMKLKNESQEPLKNTCITMFIKDKPLGEILRIFAVCAATGINIEGGEIKLSQRGTKFETKSIKVRAALIATGFPEVFYDFDGRMQKFESNPAGEGSQVLMDYFSERGISFPKGAGMVYERRAGVLLVRNTADNIRRLEALLRDLDIETPLVHVQFDMMEMDYGDLEKIMSEAKISEFQGTAFYQAIIKSKKAKISSQRVVATSGQPALGRQVGEKYFPNSWTEPALTFDKDLTSYTPSYPELGDATDLGQRLEVTATVSPNNYTISLCVHPQTREHGGWTEYPYEVIMNKVSGKTVLEKNKIKMPDLILRDIMTNVKAYDGETLLIGKTYLGFDPDKDSFYSFNTAVKNGKVNLFFLTPVLVNPDGDPVRK